MPYSTAQRVQDEVGGDEGVPVVVSGVDGAVETGKDDAFDAASVGGATVVPAGCVGTIPTTEVDVVPSNAASAWALAPDDAVGAAVDPLEPPPPQAERINVSTRREGKAE
ncbi:hypothetical protein EGT07_26825 [Herbaspirillum sp. HC18]|nr:hypothetical protein EGT07_26825 [Herbaspirillum sp. HC18]